MVCILNAFKPRVKDSFDKLKFTIPKNLQDDSILRRKFGK